jgi:hypothetical protein
MIRKDTTSIGKQSLDLRDWVREAQQMNKETEKGNGINKKFAE